MKRMLLKIIIILFAIYILFCMLVYFIQERLIFFPEKFAKDYQFHFEQPFEEINIKTKNQYTLNGLLFHAASSNKADNAHIAHSSHNINSSKGLIFYLHGNAGSVRTWGEAAKTYTDQHYDVFILDYPGYGKSEGKISSQDQLYQDLQTAYDEMKKRYPEQKIIVLGYSIGTGMATKIASDNHPKMLILQAPYYSLIDMMQRYYPILPTLILKYKFETNEYINNCKMPVIIFHGIQDEIIDYRSAIRLKKHLKLTDTVILLNAQTHNGITENPEYRNHLKNILDN